MKTNVRLTPLVRVVDDNERVRASEAFVLKIEGWQVAEYASAMEFLERDDPARPGCLVLDIRMPGMSGLELQQELKRRQSTLPILFLTGHGDVDMAVMALKRGAADFVRKPMDPEALQKAVKRMVAWHLELLEKLARKDEVNARFESLTPKEREVARLVASGLLNKQIASEAGISEQTVKTHRGSAARKLGLRSAVDFSDFFRLLDEPLDAGYPIGRQEDEP